MFEWDGLKRSIYLSKEIKNILDSRQITLQEIADKLWVSHSYISQNLSWKKIPSDSFFIKVMDAIKLSTNEKKNIFYEADWESFMYKYGDSVPNSHEMSVWEALEFIKKHANLSEAEKIVLREIEKNN